MSAFNYNIKNHFDLKGLFPTLLFYGPDEKVSTNNRFTKPYDVLFYENLKVWIKDLCKLPKT